MTKEEKIDKVIDSVKSVLIEKNKRYGNAALSPINVFYKGDAQTSIYIRLDDKLSRIKNSDVLRKNDMFDLLGYCLLLYVSEQTERLTSCGVYFGDETFEYRLNDVIKMIKDMFKLRVTNYDENEEFSFIGFSKSEDDNVGVIRYLNGICSEIKNSDTSTIYFLLPHLIQNLIYYFVENDITDFSDLID